MTIDPGLGVHGKGEKKTKGSRDGIKLGKPKLKGRVMSAVLYCVMH